MFGGTVTQLFTGSSTAGTDLTFTMDLKQWATLPSILGIQLMLASDSNGSTVDFSLGNQLLMSGAAIPNKGSSNYQTLQVPYDVIAQAIGRPTQRPLITIKIPGQASTGKNVFVRVNFVPVPGA